MTKKGFTIIETLVAVSILSIAILGAMSAIQTGLSSYIFSKNQITAFYLGQEGFEQIRNVRDENRLAGRNWLYSIAESSDPCYFGQLCTVSPVETNLLIGCAGSCQNLRQNAEGFFGYDASWSPTIFRREIQLASVNADEISIIVTVSWTKGGVARQFRAKENLLNW
ncbi:MAG TPA: prepilin-type N-terminal cleavage/methylation domain-containing protein [Candidatus Paceibacterota bacterium]